MLTAAKKDQAVEILDGCQVNPPRLGEVGEFELSLQNNRKFDIPADDSDAENMDTSDQHQVGTATTTYSADPKTVGLLKSIRIAAWTIAMLLLVLCLKR